MSLEHPGGDTRTPGAKQEIAKREQQIVALRLRHHSFTAIGRVVGISRQSAQKAFLRALRRNTDADIQTHHRSELAELEAEAAKLWTIIDAKDQTPKVVVASLNTMNRIHVRRAKLLGLDAPQKIDLRGLYQQGNEQLSAERIERQRVLEELPLKEQERIYEIFEAARRRVAGKDIETTAVALSNGNRNPQPDDDCDEAESEG